MKITENIKVHVKTVTQSRKVQEWAFKQGFKWNTSIGTYNQFTDKPYLYFKLGTKNIMYGKKESFFKKDPHKQITYKQIFPNFQIGDEVKCIKEHSKTCIIDKKGKVIGVNNIIITVEFYEHINGHDGCYGCCGKPGHCWNILSEKLELVTKDKLEQLNIEKALNIIKQAQNEVKKMELKNMKKENLKEAKKQYETEKMNKEIEYAKMEMAKINNEIDNIDRQIKGLNEERNEQLKLLKPFNTK